MKLSNFLKVTFLTGVISLVVGCAATQTALSKKNLDVQTKMSDTVFLDPVSADKLTIFVQVRNTSDKPDFDISEAVKSAITAKGYRIVNDPNQAYYLLQANVLQVGKASPSSLDDALAGGFGGGLLGAAAGYATGGDGEAAAAGAVVGQIAEGIAGALVKDVTYSIVTDIQISERSSSQVSVSGQHNLKQGSSGSETRTYSNTTDWNRYQTRVVSSANKVNLKFEEAAPQLVQGLVRAVSGVF